MMKHGKALGPDDVAIEEVEALGEFGIEKVNEIIRLRRNTNRNVKVNLHCASKETRSNRMRTPQNH